MRRLRHLVAVGALAFALLPGAGAATNIPASGTYGGIPYQGWSMLNYQGAYSVAQTSHQGTGSTVSAFWATTCPWNGSSYVCTTNEYPGYYQSGAVFNSSIPTTRAYGYHQIRVTGVGYSPSIESYVD